MIEISPRICLRAILGIYSLPLFIFFLGFFAWTYAFILFITLLGLLYLVDGEISALPSASQLKRPWSLGKRHLAVAAIFIFAWCYFAGIGHLWYQNYDYTKHNGILWDLVHRPWPVYFEQTTRGGPYYLVYYLGHYLTAGLIGKVLHFAAAEFSLLVLSISTLLLLYILLGHLPLFRDRPWIWILFPLCGGLDLIGSAFFTQAPDLQFGQLPEWWSGGGSFQYPGPTHTLFWVPQHALGSWIGITLLLLAYHYRLKFLYYFALVGSFFWSPFATMGLLPFALLGVWRERQNLTNLSAGRERTHLIIGFLATLILGLVLVFFYSTIPISSPKENMIDHLGGFTAFLPRYLKFVVLEFVLMLTAVYFAIRKQKNFSDWMPLFFTAGLLLFLWPLYYYGIFSDFTMRASLPSLFVLFFFALAAASRGRVIILMLLLLGSFSFVSDLYRGFAMKGQYYPPASMETFSKDIVFQYLGDPENDFFKSLFPER